MTTKGIPTIYQGVQFRSRLEATWAAYFDDLGWNWSYEPRDLAGYIPDFITAYRPDHETLWRPPETLIEVKPASTLEDLREEVEKIDGSGWVESACIVGLEPVRRAPDIEVPPGSALGMVLRRHKHKHEYPAVIGLVRTFSATLEDVGHDIVYHRRRVWQPGIIVDCCLCGYHKIVPEGDLLKPPPPCEAFEAEGLPCSGSLVPSYRCLAEEGWVRAKNETQWKAPGR